MPTLDRRLLAWSDSDTEDDDQLLATPTRRGPAVDDGAYDRCGAAASVDDVLVPGANDGRTAETLPAHGRGGGGVRDRPSSATRKACAAAGLGLLAVGGLCAYLAWRCGAAKLTVPS